MAEKKINEYDLAGTVDDADLFLIGNPSTGKLSKITASTVTSSRLASAAEVVAGVETAKTVTPATLAAAQPTRTFRSFGTIGNGVADDSVAVQAGITWALANNGKVVGTPGNVYGVGAVWPVATGTGIASIDWNGATIKGLAGSTVLLEVAGKAGRQFSMRGLILTGLGRATATSIGLRVRNCQTLSFDDIKIQTCGVGLDIVNDGTGPGNAWNESNDFDHFQINSCATARRMRIINSGADSFGGVKFRGHVIGDTDIAHDMQGTATWYGGSETGVVMFLSAAGSPIGYKVAGSMEGTAVEGRMESTTANTPTAISFLSTAIKTQKTKWDLTLTGPITTVSDATTNGQPKLNVTKTWLPYQELNLTPKGARVAFNGKTPTVPPGIENNATSIYNALIKLGLCEPLSPLNMAPALHAMWADDPDWAHPADGVAVDYWRNATAGGNPAATGSNRPIYRASVAALNNKAAVEFTGASSQYLDVDITNLVQPLKFVIVANITGGSSIRQLFGRGTAGGGIGIDSTNHARVHFGTLLTGAAVLTATDGHVMRATVNGASSAVWSDGASDATGNTNTGGPGRLTVGASSDATPAFTQFWTGNIAFLGIYDGSILDADLEALEDWLGVYYDIVIA